MSKTIVICCDGTGKDYSSVNTNVIHAVEYIIRDDKQIVYYDPGVGTMNFLGRPRQRSLGASLGKLFGYGLVMRLMDLYKLLMHAYQAGDKVFLFGFSRGAYTARAFAGMLYKCGLLEAGAYNLLPYVTRIYLTHDNNDIAAGFKQTFCRPCTPYFIGVWDTVKSLGYFLGKHFFDAKLNPETQYAYHALSIDEKRKKFDVALWDKKQSADQTVEQVWFPGVHSDIGGGYVQRQLSDITLEWMLNKATRAGLRLKPDWQSHLNADPCGVMHNSRTGLWKLWSPLNRFIPEGSCLHQSVLDRLDNTELNYQPDNLPREYTIMP
ncbi:MAG: DUF2235 domain-containing protein [Pseudomonadota bacterium]